jgi:hypothetical protein
MVAELIRGDERPTGELGNCRVRSVLVWTTAVCVSLGAEARGIELLGGG